MNEMTIAAREVVKGDVIRLDCGWRNVLDVWESLGFTHVVATDSTGMWLNNEDVEVSRRPQPPKLVVLRPRPSSRAMAHEHGRDCGHLHCVACWRAGRRPSPVQAAR